MSTKDNRRRNLADLDADIRDHIERETEENIARGMPPDEARTAALRTFGNVARVKEETREVWIARWLQQVMQDVQYGLRTLRRNPGFAAAAVLTLALGIGMNTAVFSVFDAVLLRPIGYPHSERLLWLATYDDRTPFAMEMALGPDVVDWRDQAASLEHVVAYGQADETVVADGQATQARVAMVSEGFWEIVGTRPAIGRLPERGEHGTIVLSQTLFERQFKSDPNVVGKIVTVDGNSVVIAAVLPRSIQFQFPSGAGPGLAYRGVEAYRTFRVVARRGGPLQILSAVGKLKAGVSIEAARAELAAIRARTAQAYPNYGPNKAALRVMPLQEKLVGDARLALYVLGAGVIFVMLIACANLANLLLGRASARQREIAIRASLGAGRARVFRQLLVESLLLAVAGAAAGLVFAHYAVTAITRLIPHAVPRLSEATIDTRVLLFALGITLVTALLFGSAPALALRKVDLHGVLKDGAQTSTSRGSASGRWLVAIEIAVAVVLLCGAGLMIKSVSRLNAHPPGFDPDRVLVMQVVFSGAKYDEDSRRRAYIDEFLERVQQAAGVVAASISTHGQTMTVATVEGVPMAPREELMMRSGTLLNSTSAEFPRAIGMRLLRGRWFTRTEPTAVVINETLSRRNFPGGDPLGKRLRLGDPAAPWYTVVGVVADLRYSQLDVAPEPEVYVLHDGVPGFSAIVRTAGDPAAAAPALQTLVAGIDPALPVFDVMPLEQALADSIAPRRFNLFLLGTFAAAALVLALVGTYGVMAYSVAQRTREIGIRMALGAARGAVVGMIVREGMAAAVAGTVVGLAAALMLTRVMATLLYQVDPRDPPTFAIVAVLLVVAAFVACWGPALKASLVDPTLTLRQD